MSDEIESERKKTFERIMKERQADHIAFRADFPMKIKEICKESHDRSVRKGFYDPPPSIDQRIALIHSEVTEAYEEYRSGHMETYYGPNGKPEGFAIEIADVAIRLFDLCEYLGIDLENVVRIKSDYNETRPHKHGKKF